MDLLADIGSPLLGLVPAAFAALLALDWVLASRRAANAPAPAETPAAKKNREVATPSFRPGAWTLSPRHALLPFVMLVAWAVLPAVGLLAAPLPVVAGCSAAVAAAGALGLRRDRVRARLLGDPASRDAGARVRRGAFDLVVLVVILACAFVAIEAPYNPNGIGVFVPFLYMDLGLMALMIIVLYFLGQRRGIGPTVAMVVFAVAGIAQYYLWQFKNAAILPTDLFALGTAAAVAGGYSYTLHGTALVGLAATAVGVVACGMLGPVRPTAASDGTEPAASARRGRAVAANLACAAAFGAALAWALVMPNYTQMGAEINYFWPLYTYRQHGSVLSFVAGAQDLVIRRPQDYSDERAESELAAYVSDYESTLATNKNREAAEAQYARQKPCIVVVMDETFADLSIYDGLKCGYEGPAFYRTGMPDSLATGALSVSVNGGGTCNTEFEFLTGNSMAYLGLGKYPYSIYDFSACDALPKQLSAEGYRTTAIHPNYASNWNRQKVYAGMGFDDFLTIDDFTDSPTFHNGVTDAATFDRVLDILRTTDDPQFVFDVTMQNHSDYNVGNIPADRLTDYQPEGFPKATNALLNEYLSCIQASDEDLERFVGELRNLDRPVVLLYFGDHQPNLTAAYNDAWYTGETELAHNQRLYQTTYTIWANYDVAGNPQTADDSYSSPAYLAAQVLSDVGAPLTDFQKAQLAMRETMPAMNAFGCLSSDGSWYEKNDESSPVAKLNADLDDITYWRFARKLQ